MDSGLDHGPGRDDHYQSITDHETSEDGRLLPVVISLSGSEIR